MKRTVAILTMLSLLLLALPALSQPDPEPKTKAPATKVEPKADTKTEPATKKAEPTKKEEPASQPTGDEPTEPKEVPKDAGEAMDAVKQVVELGKAKQWFAMSAGIIWLLMFVFKLGRKKLEFMKKIPKRALWIIVPVLSVAAMVLSKLQADLSWGAAIAVLFSGPSVAFLNDFVKRGLLGKEPSSPVNGGG